jgi:Fur family peroxide stress response transcriptional regulator
MVRSVRFTTQRKIIYEIVSDSSDHPTVADIIERLRTRRFNIAYATVYNSLRYLTEKGLIRELKLEGDASRYDARIEEHQHIVCTSCGKVDEVLTESPQDWLNRVASETGYLLIEEQFLFKGVCAKCRDLKKTVQG